MRWLLVLAIASGCIESSSVECGGRVCPSGTTCVHLQNTDVPDRCVDPKQVSMCDGIDPLEACTLSGASLAACYPTETGEVCLEAGCGNGLVDHGEACDDHNAEVGDGCSDECKSDETCGNGIVDPVRKDGDVLVADERCDDSNLIGGDGCASSCEIEQPRWERLAYSPPLARKGASMTYDTAHRRLMMFGGFLTTPSGDQPTGETWLWDGAGWELVDPSDAPAPRAHSHLAYDTRRQRAVLFSGREDIPDTWEWDGAAWHLRQTDVAPTGRTGGQMAYDPVRRNTILFGGALGSPTGSETFSMFGDDTWIWDGTQWTELQLAAHPAARYLGGITFDPASNKIVLAGGQGVVPQGPLINFADTWEWDGTQWAMVSDSGGPVGPATLAYDFGTHRVIGVESSSGKTFAWDGSSWSLVTTLASARVDSAIGADPLHGNIVMFGGVSSGTSQADTFLLSGSTWTGPVAVQTPPTISQAGAALDYKRGRLVIFGGLDDADAPQSSTWIVDGFRWTLFPGVGGGERVGASLAYDPIHDEIVRFGGCTAEPNSSTTAFAETFVWNGSGWVDKMPAQSPTPRCHASMAWDPVSQTIVLFGGSSGALNAMLDETWSWNGTTWTPLSPSMKPQGRYGAPLAFHYTMGALVLFGGIGKSTNTTLPVGYRDDAWTWTGTTWAPLQQASHPQNRAYAALVWNAARNTLMLSGGDVFGEPLEDVWELDGAKWTQLAVPQSLGPLSRAINAPSIDLSGIWQFGGIARQAAGVQTLSQARRLRFEGDSAYESCRAAIDHDGDGLAGCSDLDCWMACKPTCPPRTTCIPPDPDPSPRCGDGVCSALENCSLCPADCNGCTVICGDGICDPGEMCAADC